MRKKQHFKELFADLVSLNTYCYLLSFPIELWLAGMSFEAHLHARFIGLFIISLTARPFGIWRDYIFKRFNLNDESKGLKAYAVDTLAYLSFEMPLYITNLTISGATTEQIIKSICVFALMAGVIGRPYGLYRVFIRKKFFNLKTV